MVKMGTLAGPEFNLELSLGSCPFRCDPEMVTKPDSFRERVLTKNFLSSEPFTFGRGRHSYVSVERRAESGEKLKIANLTYQI